MKILALCVTLVTIGQCVSHFASSFNDHQDILQEILRGEFEEQKGSCSCVSYTCSCCQRVKVKEIDLDANICFSGSYLPKEYGISWSLSVNGKTYIHGKVSAKNPPPICAAIPDLKKLASLCVRFTDLDIHNHTFTGCVDLEMKLVVSEVVKVKLGCFKLPPRSSGQKPSIRFATDADRRVGQPLKQGATSHHDKTMTKKEQAAMLARLGLMGKKFTKGRLVNVVGV